MNANLSLSPFISSIVLDVPSWNWYKSLVVVYFKQDGLLPIAPSGTFNIIDILTDSIFALTNLKKYVNRKYLIVPFIHYWLYIFMLLWILICMCVSSVLQ